MGESIKDLVVPSMSWSSSQFCALYSRLNSIVNQMELPMGTTKKWALLSLIHSLNNSTESRPRKGLYSMALPYVLLSEGDRFTARLNVTLSDPEWQWEFKELLVDNIKHIHHALVLLDDDETTGKKGRGCIATVLLVDVRKVSLETPTG